MVDYVFSMPVATCCYLLPVLRFYFFIFLYLLCFFDVDVFDYDVQQFPGYRSEFLKAPIYSSSLFQIIHNLCLILKKEYDGLYSMPAGNYVNIWWTENHFAWIIAVPAYLLKKLTLWTQICKQERMLRRQYENQFFDLHHWQFLVS